MWGDAQEVSHDQAEGGKLLAPMYRIVDAGKSFSRVNSGEGRRS